MGLSRYLVSPGQRIKRNLPKAIVLRSPAIWQQPIVPPNVAVGDSDGRNHIPHGQVGDACRNLSPLGAFVSIQTLT